MPGDGPHRWRPSRPLVIAGAAAVVLLASLAVYAALPPASAGRDHARQSAGAASLRRAEGKNLTARPATSPSPSSALDPCLFGTWIGTSDDLPGTVSNQPVTYTSPGGPTQIFRPDGVNILEFGPWATETAHVNGNTWTEVYTGRATVHYETVNGELLSSDISAQGTQTLLENGSYNNGGPLTLNTQPDRYTCSATTLQIFVPDGGSEVLRRSTPPATSAHS